MHHSILSQTTLLEQLSQAQNHIPIGLEFPISLDLDHMHLIFSIIRPVIYFDQ